MMKRSIAAVTVLFAMGSHALAGGKTLFVDPVAGNDANTGQLVSQAFQSIQACVTAAANGDTVLLLPGVYSGEGNDNILLQGKTITIEGRDGAASTIIDVAKDPDCAHDFDCVQRAFYVSGSQGRDLVFKGLTIRNGDAYRAPENEEGGGAIRVDGASPTFIQCVFEDNFAGASFDANGGAVMVVGDPLFIECEFYNNWSAAGSSGTGGGRGGAVYVEGAPEFERCIFANNLASGLATPRGGAVHIKGTGSITNCVFIENKAAGDGGYGGGVYVDSAQSMGIVQIDRSTFRGNFVARGDGATFGGGVFFYGPGRISNSLFDANIAERENPGEGDPPEGAAALFRWAGASELINCTIVNHPSNTGEAAVEANNGATVNIINSVIWGNDLSLDGEPGAIQVESSIVQGGFVGATDIDPQFADAAGGDYRLAPTSPAIDAGNNAFAVGPQDLNGDTRFVDDPMTADTGMGTAPLVDLGAYEYNPFCTIADLAEPVGTLDFTDVLAFLNAYLSSAPEADLAEPFGMFDFSDIVAFLAAFGAGCP